MHRSTLFGIALAAIGLGAAAPAFAQPRGEHERAGPERREPRERPGDGHDRRDGPRERQAERGHGQWERDMREPAHYGARGPEWHRGAHIPPAYRDHAYVVNDWRAHHLAPPPRGYEWVQVGPDYVLIAVRTGIIAQIMIIG